MSTQASDAAARTRARTSLLVIFGLFAAPVALAWLLFFGFPEWVPTTTINNGTLVKPIRPLPAFQLPGLSGEDIDARFLQGKWTLLYLHKGACNNSCVQQLYTMRQVRLSQGKNIDRLQRLMLWQAAGVDEGRRNELQRHFPGQATAILADDNSQLVNTFNLEGRAPLSQDRIYLVDPLGNLMMLYEPGSEPRGMIKDLERLLKYSSLG